MKPDTSRLGKPTDNPFIESFNGSFRDECLSNYRFLSLEDEREKIEEWRKDYNVSVFPVPPSIIGLWVSH